MIAVFAALESEVSACLGSLSVTRQEEVAGYRIIEAEGAVVCQTGIGPRAREAADAILSVYTIGAALSVGIAGGLATGMNVGHVLVCERVDHESHRADGREDSVESHPGLIEAAVASARGLGLEVSTGTSITVDEVAWGAAEKAAHHSWREHDIVEMESYWIGEIAAKYGVPFLTVRTVSDGPDDEIPKVNARKDDGSLDSEALVDYIREHPEAAEQFKRLADGSQVAHTNLAVVLTGLLPPLIQHFSGAGE
jgi:nucleoside phosphorylase